MCITDKAKETSSCADLFRCGAASVCLDCRMFALRLGVSVSLIRLPRCYYYTTCKWCMVSHLSSDAGVLLALVPWLPCAVRAARVAAGCVREPGLAVSLWPGAVGLCSALLPGVWACYACPVGWACAWALSMGLFCGLVFRALYGPLKKRFIFAWFFRLCISVLFPGFVFALKFPARFSGLQRLDFFSGFFRVDFSGENFPDIFSGFYFPAFFLA